MWKPTRTRTRPACPNVVQLMLRADSFAEIQEAINGHISKGYELSITFRESTGEYIAYMTPPNSVVDTSTTLRTSKYRSGSMPSKRSRSSRKGNM